MLISSGIGKSQDFVVAGNSLQPHGAVSGYGENLLATADKRHARYRALVRFVAELASLHRSHRQARFEIPKF